MPTRRGWPVAWPYPHFMSLAPLDVWAKLLTSPRAAISPRYWPRVAAALSCSALATALTLPERIAMSLFLGLNRAPANPNQAPLFILGIYRSGTTHLQYLLDCDPNLFSPKWYHALAPQGFVISWTLMRLFFGGLISGSRPADPMEFGMGAPAEDDFALNNWSLVSALPGGLILPKSYDFFRRFLYPEELEKEERALWSRCECDFVRKMSILARGRRILLKSPSHTAHLDSLTSLFPNAKFIYISRHPFEVVRSNLAMMKVLQTRYGLQDAMTEEELERQFVREYVKIENRYRQARAKVARDRLAELRFQDLLVDPIGQIERAYSQLALDFSPLFNRRLQIYLQSVRSYKPNRNPQLSHEQAERLQRILAPLIKEFSHLRPAIPPQTSSATAPLRTVCRERVMAGVVGVAATIGCAMTWIVIARLTANTLDSLIFPSGSAIGYFIRRGAGRGSTGLALWSLFLAVLLLLGVALFNQRTLDLAANQAVPISHLLVVTASQLCTKAHLFWCSFGLLNAYKFASVGRR